MTLHDSGIGIERWSAFGLAEAIRAGSLSAVGLLDLCRHRVEAGNELLNAFVYLDWELAESLARQADEDVRLGRELGPLTGVPFAVKETEDCDGMPTRYGSLLYKDAPAATADSPHVARLRRAGAIPIGKTAAPEFMSGLLTEGPANGVTRNPWNPEMTPGGSSGGSAAAVASGMVPFATGSDGGGSLRIPAAFCGLVGHKTTFGLIPDANREPSLTSCVGVLTWDVEDTARLVDIMAGPIDADIVASARPKPGLGSAMAAIQLSGLTVSYQPNLCGAGATPEIAAACEAALASLVEAHGLVVDQSERRIDFDCNELFVGVCALDSYTMMQRHSIDPDSEVIASYVRARIQNSAAVTPTELARYHLRREELAATFADWFTTIDLLVTPTLSTVEVPAAGPQPTKVEGQELEGPAAAAPITRLANLVGLPSVSVPIGMTSSGLPIGMQIMTRRHEDALALRAGAQLMALNPLTKPRPFIE
ncbi:MAG: aspartyl-tRNA(Asn)/glutamyl-tRNA(Gln) amidotransferase subunit [Frankiales bacterium]|nr:aspartyl-tRNA(Asn)/glutamyl-tRNA(Gln) amidotransferase subunit [Frankiales bacterium]